MLLMVWYTVAERRGKKVVYKTGELTPLGDTGLTSISSMEIDK